MEEFEINGTTYIERPQSPKRYSKSASRMMIATMMLVGEVYSPPKERSLPGVNIKEEYALIQNKKSKLSRRDRNLVEILFAERYRKVV